MKYKDSPSRVLIIVFVIASLILLSALLMKFVRFGEAPSSDQVGIGSQLTVGDDVYSLETDLSRVAPDEAVDEATSNSLLMQLGNQ